MNGWNRCTTVRCLAIVAVTVALLSSLVAPPGGASSGEVIAGDANATLGTDSSADFAIAGFGDVDGYHLSIASDANEWSWRPLASILPGGGGDDAWVGEYCVTGSGRHVAVVTAPRIAANRPALLDRGGIGYIIDVEDGDVHTAISGVAIKYHSPGCGTNDSVAFVRHLGSDQSTSQVYVVDAATTIVTAAHERAGQLTSAVPIDDGVVAVRDRTIVKLTNGEETVLAAVDGEPFALRGNDRGFADLLVHDADENRVDVARVGLGGLEVLGHGRPGDVKLFSGRNGENTVVGTNDMRRAAAHEIRQSISPAPGRPMSSSIDGNAVVSTDPGATPGSGTVPTLAISEASTGARLASGSPRRGGAVTTAVPTQAAPMLVGMPAITRSAIGAATATRSSATEPACAVPRNDVLRQAPQPGASEIDYAISLAVQGKLRAPWLSRPSDFANMGLPAYEPSNDFPAIDLRGGTSGVPMSIVEAVLAQESAWRHASKRALPGVSANPLVSDYYGAGGTLDKIDFDDSDCGYGLSQATTWMFKDNPDLPQSDEWSDATKAKVAVDYAENIMAGVWILAEKWNEVYDAGVIMNTGDPAYLENWYFALWAYNSGFYPNSGGPWGLGWTNNPMNSDYPPDRGGFLRDSYADAETPNHWPYQERIIGWMETPLKSGYDQGRESYRPASQQLNIPARELFCTASNECDLDHFDPGPGPVMGDQSYCTRADRKCWWHEPLTPPGGCCATSRAPSSVDVGEAWDFYPPNCTLDAGGSENDPPPTAIIVDDVPNATNVEGCVPNWTSQGSFTVTHGEAGDGTPLGVIDWHQLGTGFGGHLWFTKNRDDPSDTAHINKGTWTPPDLDGFYEIRVHLPPSGASTPTATYEVFSGHGGSRQVPINQHDTPPVHKNRWVSLGHHALTEGARVELTNLTNDGAEYIHNVAFDALAFIETPLPDTPAFANASADNELWVAFDATHVADPSKAIVTTEWDFERSGTEFSIDEMAQGATTVWSYQRGGTKSVQVRITYGEGSQDTFAAEIPVGSDKRAIVGASSTAGLGFGVTGVGDTDTSSALYGRSAAGWTAGALTESNETSVGGSVGNKVFCRKSAHIGSDECKWRLGPLSFAPLGAGAEGTFESWSTASVEIDALDQIGGRGLDEAAVGVSLPLYQAASAAAHAGTPLLDRIARWMLGEPGTTFGDGAQETISGDGTTFSAWGYVGKVISENEVGPIILNNNINLASVNADATFAVEAGENKAANETWRRVRFGFDGGIDVGSVSGDLSVEFGKLDTALADWGWPGWSNRCFERSEILEARDATSGSFKRFEVALVASNMTGNSCGSDQEAFRLVVDDLETHINIIEKPSSVSGPCGSRDQLRALDTMLSGDYPQVPLFTQILATCTLVDLPAVYAKAAQAVDGIRFVTERRSSHEQAIDADLVNLARKVGLGVFGSAGLDASLTLGHTAAWTPSLDLQATIAGERRRVPIFATDWVPDSGAGLAQARFDDYLESIGDHFNALLASYKGRAVDHAPHNRHAESPVTSDEISSTLAEVGPDEQTVQLSHANTTVHYDIPGGAFSADQSLYLSGFWPTGETSTPTGAEYDGLQVFGTIFTASAETQEPQVPINVSLDYDQSVIGNTDPDSLSLWAYTGGTWTEQATTHDAAARTFSATFDELAPVVIGYDTTPPGVLVEFPVAEMSITTNSPRPTFRVVSDDAGQVNVSAQIDGIPLTVAEAAGPMTTNLFEAELPATPLTSGAHELKVQATDESGNTATESVTFYVDTAAPQEPTDLTGTFGDGEVELAWTGAAGANEYLVERQVGEQTETRDEIAIVTETGLTDSLAPTGETIKYWVSSLDAAGNKSNPAGPVEVDTNTPHDYFAADFHGAFNGYATASPITSGDLDVVRDNQGIVRISGTATIPSAGASPLMPSAYISVNVNRLGIWPIYLGTVRVKDPATGLDVSTPHIGNIAATTTTASGTSRWFYFALPRFITYSLSWRVEDNK